jgi:NAD(P)-dependent dehydrogenase (short-subunit alcohol dehydrogenase family)
MSDMLQDKVAIVTGAGTRGGGLGLGKATAIRFAREGAKVCLVDLERERAEETEALIAGEGGTAFVVAADVTSTEACRDIVAQTVDRWGGLDVLVNNVGITGARGRLEGLDEEVWERVMLTNLKSATFMSKHAVTAMADSGGGSIINLSSVGGIRAGGSPAYGPSKAALIALSRDIALLHGRDGIRANTIAPGHVYTPMVGDAGGTAGDRDQRREIAPLGVEGTPWDVAGAAVFLAGDDSRFVSGTCLVVDGGVSAIGALAAHRAMLAREQAG